MRKAPPVSSCVNAVKGTPPRSGVKLLSLLTGRQGSGDQIFLGLPPHSRASNLAECVKMLLLPR